VVRKGKSASNPSGGKPHPDLLGPDTDDGFAGGLSHATADMHALGAEVGIAHALGVGGKVAHCLFGHAAGLPWWRGDRWQGFNGFDEGLDLAVDQPRTGLPGPGDPFGVLRP